MGRITPSVHPYASVQQLPLPLNLALLAASVAAVVAVAGLLCGTRGQKSSTSKNAQPPPPASAVILTSVDNKAAEAGSDAPVVPEAAPPLQQAPLPPPPGAAKQNEEIQAVGGIHGPLAGEAPVVPRPRRGLSMNLSMKIPEGLVRIRTGRREQKAAEDSIWKKTIIMGEKCKAPDEDEEDSLGGAGAGSGDKTNRQKSYRPRTPRSLPVSPSNSLAEERGGDAVAAH